jgi:hypothetical protein
MTDAIKRQFKVFLVLGEKNYRVTKFVTAQSSKLFDSSNTYIVQFMQFFVTLSRSSVIKESFSVFTDKLLNSKVINSILSCVDTNLELEKYGHWKEHNLS